ncbi:glycine--tRNA ligase subunit beta [Thermoactinomyces mirandus]|uniref:Glycine--tRNA ligase beta subunit n=1 Tax=Thermoactinomyces mirandus TaxID=2756294 RepID=A0A7W1XPQ2_9BACL|nr:glycine--tRNA ligase subunit beta [Thermoactinomyces mirandus]MBA4600745.1 glycine--tRNA ligase subunit beta [Thermoactinomyces mirandus]
MSKDLLLEIGCEEIPARFVDEAVSQLGEKLAEWLKENRISYGGYRTFATPRRLAVRISDVNERQEDKHEEVKGPAERIARQADGTWSKAAQGFARKQGISADQLVIKEVKGENYVFASIHHEGNHTRELLVNGIPSILDHLHFPKTMRWNSRVRFIRPVRWLMCLLGDEVIPFSWAGLTAGNQSEGHRFLGSSISISEAKEYEQILLEQYVLVEADQRKNRILSQLRQLEEKHGWVIPVDEGLLNEVIHLVEYPTALYGRFEEEFLRLPREVLVVTMREHQRYFPVEDRNGQLLPYFVTVRNGDDRYIENVTKGNEKVLRARLADARFFFEEDLKVPLEEAVKKLDQIVYQDELGSLGERVGRIQQLALGLAESIRLPVSEQALLKRAAQICKFDVATQMVGEFPELEGVMGQTYALHAGEEKEVAQAVYEHYLPRYAGDALPTLRIAGLLSLADKMDVIVSSFGIGIQPTGSQDPYGLRRKAAGIVQILLEEDYYPLSLIRLWQNALDRLEETGLLKVSRSDVEKELHDFFALRLRTVLQEEEIRYDIIDAVLKADLSYPVQIVEKAKVLMEQTGRESFKQEVEGFTRAANLAAKAEGDQFDPSLFQEKAERILARSLQEAAKQYERARQQKDAEAMYRALAAMAPEIHQFFDQVMVMVEEEGVRNNRLALLRKITQCTSQFADFGRIVFA